MKFALKNPNNNSFITAKIMTNLLNIEVHRKIKPMLYEVRGNFDNQFRQLRNFDNQFRQLRSHLDANLHNGLAANVWVKLHDKLFDKLRNHLDQIDFL